MLEFDLGRASGIKQTESYSLMTSSSRRFAMKLYKPMGERRKALFAFSLRTVIVAKRMSGRFARSFANSPAKAIRSPDESWTDLSSLRAERPRCL